MFGWWAAPYNYNDPYDDAWAFKWDPVDYGLAFTSVRRRLLEVFPEHELSFGLVVNDDEESRCQGSHICYWVERMLDETEVGTDADWLSMHRYFSDYNREWVHDDLILKSGPPMLDKISNILNGYWERRGLPSKPVGLTEYNAVFRQTPACGGSQQFISLLWQAKFIGEAAWRDDFKLLNHFAARAVPVGCTGKSDFAFYQVDGVKARAPRDSYSIVAPGIKEYGDPAKPTPAYYGFWLWNRYMGEDLIQYVADDDVTVFVSRFAASAGTVGLLLVNTGALARKVELAANWISEAVDDTAGGT